MTRPALLAAACVLAAAAPAFAQKEFGFDNTKPSGQPYLAPEESVKRMKVAPEFEVKLFAAEPLVVNPIAFTIDEKGRVWVVECFEYPSRTPKGKAPRDRIVILEDTDGDGVCDKRTVFAEGKDFPVLEERRKQGLGAFDLASGIEVGHGGVYVGAPPYLWFIENKDDKPGKFEVLLSGFGSQDTHETLNTFQWGPDGWLYGMQGVFTQSNVTSPGTAAPGLAPVKMTAAVWRYHPKQKKFEIFAEGTSNPWGLDWRNTDGQFILACCVIPHLFHVVPGGIYKRQAGASLNPYAYGYIDEICDHTFHRESGWAHAGLISLDAPHIPEKYRDSVIFGSIHGCSVKRNTLKPNGSTYRASKAEDFLVSGDKNFRPINMRWGPLGDIYLIDWHDQNPCHQAKPDSWDYEHGRVFRIQLKGTQSKKAEDLGRRSLDQLCQLIGDANPYLARTAARLLSEREQSLAGHQLDDLSTVMAHAVGEGRITSLASMWPAFMRDRGRGASDFAELAGELRRVQQTPPVQEGLKFLMYLKESSARTWVVRHMAQQGLTEKAITNLAELGKVEASAGVRRELASAAIRLGDKRDVAPLLHALMARKEDAKDPVIPHLVWYAYEKVLAKNQGASNPPEKELAWLMENAAGNPLVTDHIVPRAMRRLVATGRPEDLALCVKFAAGLTDAAARKAALDGLTVALKDQVVDAPAGWSEAQNALLATNDQAVVELVNKLAVSFRDPAALQRAFDTFRDKAAPPDKRAEALRQLVQLRHKDAGRLVQVAVRQDEAPRVRAEAARQLAAFDDVRIAEAVVADWKHFPREVRSELVNSLASRKEWARVLLRALGDRKIDRAEVTDNVITRIQAFNDKGLAALIEKHWGRTRPTPKELDALIDKMRTELAGGPASFARGKLVFENQCAKCHRFEGKGADVGPALDGAARDIEYILANVIDPNRVIGAPYFQRIVKTLDGRVEQGLLAEEDDKSITLKVEKGELRRFARADLDGPVQVLEKSMMPEGLTAGMSAQDFRDLERYLMANPFLTDVTMDGKSVSAPPTGRVPLPDGKTEAVVEAEVTAADDVTTQLLVGGVDEFEVKLDGKVVGKGAGKRGGPDQAAVDVALPKGSHKLTLSVKYKGAGPGLYARLLDPERKLSYPDSGAKK
jgi:putative membrane-bound dehydrogenase-like protein